MTNEEIRAIRSKYQYDPSTLNNGVNNPSLNTISVSDFSSPEVVPQEKTFGQKAIGVAGEIVKPFERLGQGVLNATAGNLVGKESQITGLFGNQVDTLGYRDGQALQGGELAKDVAGNLLDVGSYAVPVGTGAKVLTKIGKGVKAGAIAGGMTGTGQALQEGQTIPEALGQGAVYGAGGAVLGGAIPGVVSGAGAVYNKLNPSEKFIESQIVKQFTKGVKPILPGKTTPNLLSRYNDNVVTAVKTIKANKDKLTFTDEVGDVVTGQTPKNLNELNNAVEQTKKVIFSQYDELAKTAGQKGMTVDTNPISSELDVIIGNKALSLTNPNAVKYAQSLKERLITTGSLDAETAQEVVQNYNKSLEAFYKNPTYDNASQAAIDSVVANNIRKALDEGITGITGKEYQALKNQYGALKAVERDVIKASLRDARKNVKGLIDFTDIFSGGQVVAGITSLNPSMIASGLTQKAIASIYKHLNDPNRAISKMFEAADTPVGGVVKPVSDAVRNTVGGAIKEAKANPMRGSVTPGEFLPKKKLTTQQEGMKNLTEKVAKEHGVEFTKDGNLVLYHGTQVGRAPKIGDEWRIGSYFTSDENVAKQFAGQGGMGEIKIMKVEVPPQTVFPSGDGTYYTLNEKIPVKEVSLPKKKVGSEFQDMVKYAQDLGIKKINPDGTVTLYHATPKGTASVIEKSGFNKGTYFALSKNDKNATTLSDFIKQDKFKNGADLMEIKIDPRGLSWEGRGGTELISSDNLIKDIDGIYKLKNKVYGKDANLVQGNGSVYRSEPISSKIRKGDSNDIKANNGTYNNKGGIGNKEKSSPLEQEAKKYKSAEEFVKAKEKDLVYHGTSANLKSFNNKQGTFFTDDFFNAEGYASGNNVYEGYLNLKNPLVIDAKGKLYNDLKTEYGKTTNEIVGKVDKSKYDGVIFKNIKDNWIDDADYQEPTTIYYAFKPRDSFLNESQLTDIWKKANKK